MIASYFENFDHILVANLPEVPTPTSVRMHLQPKVWRCILRNADDILNDHTNSGGYIKIENPRQHKMSCYVEMLCTLLSAGQEDDTLQHTIHCNFAS